jgi:hypothetical protein
LFPIDGAGFDHGLKRAYSSCGANLYTHLFINMVQKELNFKNYNKDWRLSSAFDRHSPAKRDEVGELVHLAGNSVPRSATNNNI